MDECSISLDEIGILEGTNKSSLLADYLRHYDRLFSVFRNEQINLIEIGVLNGDSLRMWAKFFPNARIIGIDITEDCRRHANDRIIVEIGSQTDPGLLARICAKYPPTIIVDDGSHQAKEVLFTFQTAFPYLLPGGLYAMEDLFFHYGKHAQYYRHNVQVSPSEYIFALGHNLIANSLPQQENYGISKYLFDNINNINVFRNAIVVEKTQMADWRAYLAQVWSLAERSGRAENWYYLANLIFRNKGPLDQAAAAAEQASKIDNKNAQYHYRHGMILSAIGDRDAAIAAMQRALEVAIEPASQRAAQGQLERLTGHQ